MRELAVGVEAARDGVGEPVERDGFEDGVQRDGGGGVGPCEEFLAYPGEEGERAGLEGEAEG